jgi:hypothetical protein
MTIQTIPAEAPEPVVPTPDTQFILSQIGKACMTAAPEGTGVALLVFLPEVEGKARTAQFITNMPELTVVAAMKGTIATLERQSSPIPPFIEGQSETGDLTQSEAAPG